MSDSPSAPIAGSITETLRDLAIDWDDFESASRQSESVLRALAHDRRALNQLIRSARENPRLFEKCEERAFGYKIVLWEDPTANVRIRLHVSTVVERERPHTHRFTFTTLILHGFHAQTWYRAGTPIDDEFDPESLEVIGAHEEVPGSCFTTHHEAIHASTTPPEIVALVLRGPAVKDRALVTRRGSRQVWWRVGEKDETAERRQEVKMSPETFSRVSQRLRELDLI